MSNYYDDGSVEQERLVKESRRAVELTQVRASAVPAVPKEITATQRLAALTLAQECEDLAPWVEVTARPALNNAAKLLRELAK